MRVLRWAGRIAVFALVAFGLLTAALVAAITVGISVSLDPLRGEFETMAKAALDRSVVIEGHVEVVPTWWPTLEIGAVRIAHPAGWPESSDSSAEASFARAENLFARLAIFPLLAGELRVLELSGKGIELNMGRLRDGRTNWDFDLGHEASDDDAESEADAVSSEPRVLALIGVDKISLSDVTLHYSRPDAPAWEYELTELSGSLTLDAPLELKMEGSLQRLPYSLELSGGELQALNVRGTTWPLDVRAEIAGTSLELHGRVESHWSEDDEAAGSEATSGGAPSQASPPAQESPFH
jgi:uncharacterized protein involved in outer membrane biogenesis